MNLGQPSGEDRHPPRRVREAFTLMEMMITLVIVGIMLAIGLRPLNQQRLKINARSARVEASMGLALARTTAMARGCVAVFHLNVAGTPNSAMWVTACKASTIGRVGAGVDTLGRIDTLNKRFGVTVTGTADSLRYDSRGLTVGYASGAYAFSAGAGARDTLTVNPMGRVAQ
jgi:prepilin-type N-terminal cleavage/methylation domain-containing protein